MIVPLSLMLFLQVIPQLRVPEPEAKRIVGPYIFREDRGPTTKVILQNGLTVIVREQHAVPLASIVTYVKAGYFDETDRLSGLSHVIEHMFFKGTKRRPVGEIARQTRALGGYLNAYTYYDRTVYCTVVPEEGTKQAIDIQADALWNAAFDPEELKREVEVVLQENRRKLDNPSAVTSEKLYSVAFQRHPMRRWRIGTPEGLRGLKRDDVLAYYNLYYTPSNIILAIVGKFDREDILKEVVRLYGGKDDQPVTRDRPPEEPKQNRYRYAWQRGALEQSHVAMGFHVPGVLSDEAPVLEALAAILSSGRASRLNRFLRDEKRLLSNASANHHGFRDLGYFEIDLETEKPLEAQIGVLAELDNIKKFGITAEGLARAKASIARSHYLELETVNGVAEELAAEEALGDWKRSEGYLGDIQKVTATDVVNVAKKYLMTENLSVFEYFPESVTRAFSEQDYQNAVLEKVESGIEDRSTDNLPVVAEIRMRPEGIAEDVVRPIRKHAILRGPEVYVREDHRVPIVSFGIFFPGGRLYETPENAGITELMLRSALRGTQRFNSSDIARRLENAGAEIRVVNEPDFFGYIIDGMAAHIDQALELLMDVLHEPTFPEDQVALEKELQRARIKKLRESNYLYPLQLFMRTVFKDHPYAIPGVGDEKSMEGLNRDRLVEWFRKQQRTVLPLIVIVGDTHGTGPVASIADALTNEDLRPVNLSALPVPRIEAKVEETIEAFPRQQTAMVYGFAGATRQLDDRFALDVLENIVSGLGGRFFDAIREKQGLAYTVQSSNASFTKSGAFFTYTAFSPENESKVRASLEKEIERLRKEGVSADEVRKAIKYSAGKYEIHLQSRTAQVLEYARAVFSGAGIYTVTEYGALVHAVSAENVKAAAVKYLSPQMLKVAVVRGVQ